MLLMSTRAQYNKIESWQLLKNQSGFGGLGWEGGGRNTYHRYLDWEKLEWSTVKLCSEFSRSQGKERHSMDHVTPLI